MNSILGSILGILAGYVIIIMFCAVVYWRLVRRIRREEREHGRRLVRWLDGLRNAKTWEERQKLLEQRPNRRS